MPAQPPGFTPSVKQWFDKLVLKSEGTAKGYFSNLKTYWNVVLKTQGFSTIDDWVESDRRHLSPLRLEFDVSTA
jgi:hypothetical protein